LKNTINLKKEVASESLDKLITNITEQLKIRGFGVLTRIDFHEKMKEKLNVDIDPVVILGACNPKLAYEAYQKNTDITALIPCNAVIRKIGDKKYSVELAKPSALMLVLGEENLAQLAEKADAELAKVLENL
jgi:uncharacterized protein (DUF302 family)